MTYIDIQKIIAMYFVNMANRIGHPVSCQAPKIYRDRYANALVVAEVNRFKQPGGNIPTSLGGPKYYFTIYP